MSTTAPSPTTSSQERLLRIAASLADDPLKFVQLSFPWGEGTLVGMKGPDKWQTDVLTRMRDHIASGKSYQEVFRLAVASGNGIGKSCLVAWIILWAMCTRADTRVLVTANTESQLNTRTFAELGKWYNVCPFKSWFKLSAKYLASAVEGHEKTWLASAIPWSKENPEAMAGTHNQGRRTVLIFDEASAIADPVWDAIQGALSGGNEQIWWLVFGNPTRSSGRFYECFNRFRHRWIHLSIDSRDAAATNKEEIARWVADLGEDSDWVKVHVRGIFPSASSSQFIGRDLVDQAADRELRQVPYTKMAAIIGVDVARFGDDASVLRVRFGPDARSWPKRKFRKLDGWQLGTKIAELYNELKEQGVQRIYINVDNGGVGASPVDWLQHNGYPCMAVNFGGEADDDKRYKNKRAEMWGRLRDWLKGCGCIDGRDDDLTTDLTGVEYGYTPSNQIFLEKKEDMKKRGLHSPDDADALALTFAVPVNEYLDDLPSPDPGRRHRLINFDPFG